MWTGKKFGIIYPGQSSSKRRLKMKAQVSSTNGGTTIDLVDLTVSEFCITQEALVALAAKQMLDHYLWGGVDLRKKRNQCFDALAASRLTGLDKPRTLKRRAVSAFKGLLKANRVLGGRYRAGKYRYDLTKRV
jgi:hypothetical protein